MNSPVKFGLVGAGGIAQSYLQAFATCEVAELVAVADLRPEAAKAMAETAKCQSFESHQAMLAAADLDAAIICTPPTSHPHICVDFLEQQVHVLCEKPLSVDLDSALMMQATARQAGVILTMASKFRYVEDVIKAKSILASGILGEVVLFENAFTGRVDMASRWNANPVISGGGVLIDNGTHSVDIMRYFLGALSEIQVVEGKRVQGLPVEDTVRIFVKSTSGVMGNIDLSWSINKELDYYLRIYGSQGTISVGWKESKYRQASSPEWIQFGNGYNKVQAFRSQIENFSRAIRGEESLLITAEDGIASVEAIEAAYRSLHQDRWTPILQTTTDLNGRKAAAAVSVV
ncbi:MAG: Gfo/Idh/MocA family oxidoreductase [Pegethrix bostrychoides GSE-TBD4-15B]|jgi:predicted dehydrogenase|uniref:Gfo/Idh/MocA family oxidoreductase n=1 Tax=Pegethrix bostrychoides GSE-TBD4-15B TaxID=2839662 RepID=A0A951PD57_9CYAN|nr:Gfo/Idh/MocA family oxidoreductase [Pegethrix bostrychoides GSE-TBD4-15B]